MFERITFRKQNTSTPDRPIDVGLLLEALLFYQKTIVVADASMLRQLVTSFGFDLLNEILDHDILEILYTEEFTPIHTQSQPNGIEFHSPVIITSPQHTFPIEIRKMCIEHAGKEGKGRRNATRLEGKIKVIHHDPFLSQSAKELLLDNDYLNKTIPQLLKIYVPELGDTSGIQFATENAEKGIVVSTNIDFVKINTLYHKRIPPSHSSLSQAWLLSAIYNMEADLYFSSRNLSEIVTHPPSTMLISAKVGHLARRFSKSAAQKDAFQDFVFKENKSIRDAYNSGQIDLETIMKVIRRADKFKSWLAKHDIDSDLIREYYKEITKTSPVDKLPAKSVRWSIFTGLGLASDLLITGGLGTVAGVSLSLLDAFVLDKLIKGWKPNQFVEESLVKLIKSDS